MKIVKAYNNKYLSSKNKIALEFSKYQGRRIKVAWLQCIGLKIVLP